MPKKHHPTPIQPWTKVGGPQAGSIAALVISPEDNYSIFIGTLVGLFRSTSKAGHSAHGWERLANAPAGIISMSLSPNYADDHTLIIGTNSGIFYSHDAGRTWQTAQIPLSSSTILSINFSPNFLADGVIIAGTLEDGIFYSDSRGERWVNRGFGLLDPTVYTLVISPAFDKDGMVYAGTDTAIYYSYNSARAWRPSNFPESAAPVLSLALSPAFAEDQTIFAGTENNGLYRSVDRGLNWQKLEFPAESVNTLLFTQNGKCLLASTELGIYQSNDKGDTWKCLVDFPVVINLAAKDNLIIAGIVDRGVWLSEDQINWAPIADLYSNAFVGLALSEQFEKDNTAFMFGSQDGIWRTEDGGNTWSTLNENLPCIDINSLGLSPRFSDDHGMVVTSQSGLWRSNDAGNHWQLLLEKPSGCVSFSPDGKILAVSLPGEGIQVSDQWFDPTVDTWHNVPGPWDAGGIVMALSVTNNNKFRVALLEGVGETVSIWQGNPNQIQKIIGFPAINPPVISFWIPTEPMVDQPWFASSGNKVWMFSSRSGERYTQSDILTDPSSNERVLSLTGIQNSNGFVLFACTGQHLYKSLDAKSWIMAHDFIDDRAISIALTPGYNKNQTIYALLLGGILSKGYG